MYNLTATYPLNPSKMKERLDRVLELARNLSTIQESEPYVQSLLSAAVELTESETASILNYDAEIQELRFAAVPWYHRDALKLVGVPVEGSAAGWVIQEKLPLVIADVSHDSRHFVAADRISDFHTRSILAVPLFYKGKVIGVFEALNKTGGGEYTDDDVVIMETLASLAVAATQNELLERRIQTSYEEVAELDRLKSDFIAITSHELRTPLGLILGHATFLREVLGEAHYEQLDSIIRNATKLKDIVENLSNVDNYQSGVARLRQNRISVSQVIQDVATAFQEIAAEKAIDLKVNTGSNDLLMEGDGTKIGIALSNLIKNALTFTNNGGQVHVTAEAVPGYVKVSVMDNGVGIPSSDLPRVFERFFQVESHLTRRHGGMGLGLAVAKAMIEMHSGRIWAESVEGKGSNFTFLLPLDVPQSTAVSP
jgi:signal transduction histidine kinase